MSDYISLHWPVTQNVRIFLGCEMRIEKFVRGSLFGITRLCRVMPNSDPEEQIFLSPSNNHDIFFFLHTFWSPAFDFNIGVAINEPRSCTLTSAILKVDLCDVTTTSTTNFLTTKLRDLLYNQCIDNTSCYMFFIYPMGQIKVCKIISIFHRCEVRTEISVSRKHRRCHLSHDTKNGICKNKRRIRAVWLDSTFKEGYFYLQYSEQYGLWIDCILTEELTMHKWYQQMIPTLPSILGHMQVHMY